MDYRRSQTTISVWGKVRRVQQGDEFPDNSTALRAFYLRLAQDEAAVDAVTRDDITQAEFDAFCAARYNIGPAFDRATFLKLFNERARSKLVADSLRANYHRRGSASRIGRAAGVRVRPVAFRRVPAPRQSRRGIGRRRTCDPMKIKPIIIAAMLAAPACTVKLPGMRDPGVEIARIRGGSG